MAELGLLLTPSKYSICIFLACSASISPILQKKLSHSINGCMKYFIYVMNLFSDAVKWNGRTFHI